MEIISTSGWIIKTENFNPEVDLSTLANGVYFLVFYIDGQRYYNKFSKI